MVMLELEDNQASLELVCSAYAGWLLGDVSFSVFVDLKNFIRFGQDQIKLT